MKEKYILNIAHILSIIFTPFYLPLVGMIALFVFSYLSLLPWTFKIFVILLTYLFTVYLPTLLIHIYHKYQGWNIFKKYSKEGRMVPYIISITSYFICFYLMNLFHFPHIMSAIVVTALFLQILCAIINVWWKISVHTAAIGCITGGMLAFAEIFLFNPLWWLCFLLIIAGLVGTGRMLLRQHSLHEVVFGYLLGVITSFIMILTI